MLPQRSHVVHSSYTKQGIVDPWPIQSDKCHSVHIMHENHRYLDGLWWKRTSYFLKGFVRAKVLQSPCAVLILLATVTATVPGVDINGNLNLYGVFSQVFKYWSQLESWRRYIFLPFYFLYDKAPISENIVNILDDWLKCFICRGLKKKKTWFIFFRHSEDPA